MNQTAVITRIHAAISKSRICHRHETRIVNGACHLCVLEGLTGRFQRTVKQITAGVVAPSWERNKL